MRRKLITHPGFQATYIGSFLLGVGLILVSIPASFYLTVSVLTRNPNLSDDQIMALHQWTQGWLTPYCVIAILILILAAAIGLNLSSKHVGPIRRLESSLNKFLKNKSENPPTLRTRDDLNTSVLLFNEIVRKYEKAIDAYKNL